MGRGTPNGGRGAARNNNTYGNRGGGGQGRPNKLDVSTLGLVSPLGGGIGLSALNALHSTVHVGIRGIGGLGGLQQSAQQNGLLGGGTAINGSDSNELAGLYALLGGSQSHEVTLNAMQVLQDLVQQAMAAHAATKQKEAEAVL